MFRYSYIIDSLLKAMTHKYVRRIPKGVTKTGATKYMYFYAGQEGHGKGVAHEEELVTGASFAFGEHGKTRYHAHITKVDGDKLTIKYDDGDKKGTEETMTKKQFQALVHGEHATGIKQAKEKAEKQLKDFQAGKEKGVKVKQETLDKLEQRVKNLDALAPTAQEDDSPLGIVKEGVSRLIKPLPIKKMETNFHGVIDAPIYHLGLFGKSTLQYIDPKVHKNIFIEKDGDKLNFYVEKANKSGDMMLIRSTTSKNQEPTFSISVPTRQLQEILGQETIDVTPDFKYKDNALYFESVLPFDDPRYFGRRRDPIINENNFYKIAGATWQRKEDNPDTPQKKGIASVMEQIKKYQNLSNIAQSLSNVDPIVFRPGVKVEGDTYDVLASDTSKKQSDRYMSNDTFANKLLINDLVNTDGELVDNNYKQVLDRLQSKEKDTYKPSSAWDVKNYVTINRRWDTKEKTRYEKVIKPALKHLGLSSYETHHTNTQRKTPVIAYTIPLYFLNKASEGPEQALKDLFDDTKIPEIKYKPLTDKQKDIITKYNKNDVKGFKSFIFEDDSIGDEIENEDMGSKDPDKLHIYAEGTYSDRETLNKLGFRFVQKKEGEKNISYYKYKSPISKL